MWILLNLTSHTEDPDGVKDIVNIFMFQTLFLSAVLRAALVVRQWDTALDSRTLVTYSVTASLL